ncbi:MAG: diaminopimelate decarboxylase [Myxococcota bacterium]|nr:diaminopimelate decarboxylase [Myxococcota bacterium]
MDRGSRTDVPSSAHFRIEQGQLAVDGVRLEQIAAEVGTPTHVYSASAIRSAYRAIDAALGGSRHLICYAMKANGHPAILRLLAELGAGADVVSGGELHWALRAGIPAERIVFSGVGKTDVELAAALDAGIRAIHVESEGELDAIERLARARGVRARIALRVNPDVDPETHPYIATGLHDTKFGLAIDVARRLLPRILGSAELALDGIAAHIGSQISGAQPMEDAVAIVAAFAKECADAGAPIRAIDAGGGWPIHYGDEDVPFAPWEAFGEAIRRGIVRGGAAELDLDVVVEPGRALVGDAGALLTRVIFVKEQASKRFVIVDAAMTELVRPSLYGAYHAVMPVAAREGEAALADVVGPVCETADFLALGRPLPPVERGDLLLVRGTGAYGASMATRYNARPLAAEVLVDEGAYRVIRARERIEDLHPA